MGTGVSKLLGLKVGTPAALMKPNSTLPPLTRSVMPSPLTSAKYASERVNVLLVSAMMAATNK